MQAPMVYRVDKASARLAGPVRPSRVARHGSRSLAVSPSDAGTILPSNPVAG